LNWIVAFLTILSSWCFSQTIAVFSPL
jgi:hypothetical protein